MKELTNNSVWAYAVKQKGCAEEKRLVDQILQDLETAGVKSADWVVKTDQENAITELQNEIARQPEIGNTTPDNS